MGIKISQLPAASSVTASDVIPGVQSGATKKFSLSTILAWLRGNITPANIGAVPDTREVAGHALSSDVTLTASDVGLGNVDNVQQYSASNPPPYPVTSVNGSTGAVTVSVPSISTSTPNMDGTAAAGSTGDVSDAGHVHPHDTSKAGKTDLASIQATGATNTTGAAIDAGTYFYLDGELVQAKTKISAGGTFTRNGNYAAVSSGSQKGALNVLEEYIASIDYFTAISSSSKTVHAFTVPNSSRHVIFSATSAASAGGFAAIVSAASNGTVRYLELGKGTGVTFSVSANTFTVTLDDAAGLAVKILRLHGSPMSLS